MTLKLGEKESSWKVRCLRCRMVFDVVENHSKYPSVDRCGVPHCGVPHSHYSFAGAVHCTVTEQACIVHSDKFESA